MITEHAPVAGERHFESTTKTRPMNGGHHGCAQRGQPIEHALAIA
jgi:hypothetical protein